MADFTTWDAGGGKVAVRKDLRVAGYSCADVRGADRKWRTVSAVDRIRTFRMTTRPCDEPL